ncbi:4Fe-4S dicluster domain-containing protein [Xylanibacter oryzae]|jgi:2-oxoglutarate ferredoxin oxidoreductase subunit delta|uniref:4Fe-4S dicluster domain-containing protein n=1 Tax=Xylanibacter oryzae TaxID=185293 RepID=UPI000567708F|nr:4Fe-4S binding protein [Xylanibacter oryzae]MBP7358479.1 4Fe-4S binding protein [Prevotella sp.]
MSKMKGAIVVNTDRCKGCALCVYACPQDVIALAEKKVNVHGYPYVEAVKAEACVGCSSCAIVCPDGCIEVYRKKMEE